MTDLRLFDEKQAQRLQAQVLDEEVRVAGVGMITVSTQSNMQVGEERIRTSDLFDKVDQPYGSGAGAGSDFYHLYKKQREREINRLEQMDKDHDKRIANKEFHDQRNARFDEMEEKTLKKREKRQRQKELAAAAKKRGKAENKFADDGSFMKEQKQMEEEKLEKIAKQHEEGITTDSVAPITPMEQYASTISGPVVTATEMQGKFKIRDLEEDEF